MKKEVILLIILHIVEQGEIVILSLEGQTTLKAITPLVAVFDPALPPRRAPQ